MKTRIVPFLIGSFLAGAAHADPCKWPCDASLTCRTGSTAPPVSTCAIADSCALVTGDGETRARFDVVGGRLDASTESDGALLSSGVKVVDSITAHGGSGGPVNVTFELEVRLERLEPAWPGGSAPKPGAWASTDLLIVGVAGLGFVTPASGVPGHTVDTRTLTLTRPIVPEGAPLVVEWSAGTFASNGGRASATGAFRVISSDPSVQLVHCRDIPVATRPSSWGALKAAYR